MCGTLYKHKPHLNNKLLHVSSNLRAYHVPADNHNFTNTDTLGNLLLLHPLYGLSRTLWLSVSLPTHSLTVVLHFLFLHSFQILLWNPFLSLFSLCLHHPNSQILYCVPYGFSGFFLSSLFLFLHYKTFISSSLPIPPLLFLDLRFTSWLLNFFSSPLPLYSALHFHFPLVEAFKEVYTYEKSGRGVS